MFFQSDLQEDDRSCHVLSMEIGRKAGFMSWNMTSLKAWWEITIFERHVGIAQTKRLKDNPTHLLHT